MCLLFFATSSLPNSNQRLSAVYVFLMLINLSPGRLAIQLSRPKSEETFFPPLSQSRAHTHETTVLEVTFHMNEIGYRPAWFDEDWM